MWKKNSGQLSVGWVKYKLPDQTKNSKNISDWYLFSGTYKLTIRCEIPSPMNIFVFYFILDIWEKYFLLPNENRNHLGAIYK